MINRYWRHKWDPYTTFQKYKIVLLLTESFPEYLKMKTWICKTRILLNLISRLPVNRPQLQLLNKHKKLSKKFTLPYLKSIGLKKLIKKTKHNKSMAIHPHKSLRFEFSNRRNSKFTKQKYNTLQKYISHNLVEVGLYKTMLMKKK